MQFELVKSYLLVVVQSVIAFWEQPLVRGLHRMAFWQLCSIILPQRSNIARSQFAPVF